VRPADGGATELVPMRWGLIPYWWKKPLKQLPATFNARAESVADKPMFRDAFKRHRCIIPASGYYEWIKRPDGKQPYFISAADGGVLSFAGLWDRWKTPETGEPVMSSYNYRHGCQCTDPTYSRPHAGAARQGGHQILAEWHRWDRTASTGRRGSPSHVAGVAARQQDRHR
jgi:hypothetical protein